MSRRIALTVHCLFVLLTSVGGRMVPSFYASSNNNYNQYALDGHFSNDYASSINRVSYLAQKLQNEAKLKSLTSIDSDSEHENSYEENVADKHNLANTFQNNEWKNDGSGYEDDGFGLKSSTALKEGGMIDMFRIKTSKPSVDPSSPHIIKVPVPQPYPVHIPVEQPFTVPIYRLVPLEVEKKVPIHVEKIVPVYKEKPVKIIVEKHFPVPVYKPYMVPVEVNTHILHGKKEPW